MEGEVILTYLLDHHVDQLKEVIEDHTVMWVGGEGPCQIVHIVITDDEAQGWFQCGRRYVDLYNTFAEDLIVGQPFSCFMKD